jgi:hypothetical protein
MLGEVDPFETYGGAVGRFFDTGIGTFTSIIIGTAIIGRAICKRPHDLRPSAPVVTAQPKIPEQPQIGPAGPTAAQLPPVALERVFVPPELTPERLLSFFQENTNIQAAELTRDRIGQWMRVTETVQNVGAFNGSFVQVSLRTYCDQKQTWFDYVTFYCFFRGPQIDRLKILKRGD